MESLCVYILLFLCSTCVAALVNVTIDDTFGDSETATLITYLPPGAWNFGPNCVGCTARLDATKTRNGTWHDGTYNKSRGKDHAEALLRASVSFHGSAIYVYCILANTQSHPYGYTDMTFLIDSKPSGTFTRTPHGRQLFEYDVLVFAIEFLPHTTHTLTIQNGHIGGQKSLVLLDYIVYSHEAETTDVFTPTSSIIAASPPTASGSSPNAPPVVAVSSNGKIVGGILGSIGFLLLLLGLVIFLWRRKCKSKATVESTSQSIASKRTCFLIFHGTWFPKWSWFPKRQRDRRFSFNPSVFVRPMLNQKPTFSSLDVPIPVPITTVHTYRGRVDSRQPLQPNREYTRSPPLDVLAPATAPLDPRLEPVQRMSIVEWQRRTRRETEAVSPRFDVSSVEIPSNYEFSGHGSSYVSPDPPPPPTPRVRPRSVPRRFTVFNN